MHIDINLGGYTMQNIDWQAAPLVVALVVLLSAVITIILTA